MDELAQAPKFQTLPEAEALFSALRTISDVAGALTCQPRFWNSQRRDHNAAGKHLNAIITALAQQMQELANQAEVARASTTTDADYRASILIEWEVYCGGSPETVTAIASERLAFTETVFNQH